MRKIIVGLILVAAFFWPAILADTIDADCTYHGKRLYGKIIVVSAFPDITVQIVDEFPDLKVQKVTVFPNYCGQWQMVEMYGDLKIQYVDSDADIKVKFVDAFPGL